MKGYTHALSGAAAWLALAPLIGTTTHVSPAAVVIGTAATAGTAMLPDMDHGHASVAQTFGWPTRIMARVIGRVSGGHRHGTHSLLFAVLAGVLAWFAVTTGFSAVPLCLALGLGVRALGFTAGGWFANSATFTLCAGAAVIVAAAGMDLRWLGAAYTIGCAAHLAGDALTPGGVPVLWPWKRRVAMPLAVTDGVRERWVIVPALTVTVLALSLARAGAWPLVGHILAAVVTAT